MHKHSEKEPLNLQQLSVEQLEQALAWLDSPVQCPPPEGLESLNQVEWFLLDRMLQGLLWEREHNPLQ